VKRKELWYPFPPPEPGTWYQHPFEGLTTTQFGIRCPCGESHTFSDPKVMDWVWEVINENGWEIRVATPDGTWLVPRIWIAAHGLKSSELPVLAEKYGWRKL
jgi:hypothetical protein